MKPHTTVINWVKQVGKLLPDVDDPEVIPEVGSKRSITNSCKKKTDKIWLWTAVDHFQPGILGWVLGDRAC